MANHDSDFGAFLAGFVIGGLVGAAVSLLLAPQSGEETRAFIKDKSIELKDKASETAEEALARAEKAAAEARSRADELTKQARERAEELRKRGQQALEAQRQKIETAIESGMKAVKPKEAPAPSAEPPAA
jgi:gas vesicle protein